MKRVTKKRLMLLLKSVFVIALFSVIAINMYSVNAVEKKDYSKWSFEDFEEENKENWEAYCNESFNDQGTEAVEECYTELSNSLKDFYNKLYKLLAKYQEKNLYITDEVILWTVFYGQYISPTTGNAPYTQNQNNNSNDSYKQWSSNYWGYSLDNSDGSDMQVEATYTEEAANYYANETDTLKILVRNSVGYYTHCYGVLGPVTITKASDGSVSYSCPDGGTPTSGLPHEDSVVCADAYPSYEIGFWKYFTSRIAHDENLGIFKIVRFLGLTSEDEFYNTCMSYNDSGKYTAMHYTYDSDPHESYNMYFDFLSENAYFDGKSNLQYFFQDVLDEAKVDCIMSSVCTNSLEALGEDEFKSFEDKLKADRMEIIYNILEILDENGIGIQYGSFVPKSDLIEGGGAQDRKAYYWPIGSDETEEKNGVLYATGEPASTNIVSFFGNRKNEATGENEDHKGIDISGTEGTTNVIAVEKGEVVSMISNCSSGDYTCNEGYGNTIIISHTNGDYTVYGSLASIDSSVSIGTTVQKGQVIGKVGSTGATKSSNLHFEIRVNGEDASHAVDPTTLISASEPRPAGLTGSDFSMRETVLTKEEFVSGLTSYCASNGCAANKLGYFAQNAGKIYDLGVSNNVNPEFVVARAVSEGFSPETSGLSGSHNYWGIGCTNTGGISACTRYSSFEAGIKGLANLSIVKNYDSALEVFTKGHYAYVGDYWYNPGSWSTGGCKYIDYIAEYYTDLDRLATVKNACQSGKTCSGSSCLKTNDQDQEAYGYYQIRNMTQTRYNIWGL